MAQTAPPQAGATPMLASGTPAVVLALFALFAAALVAGWFSHTAGAVVAVLGGLGLMAWWFLRVRQPGRLDPAVLGLVIVGASPLVPARLGIDLGGVSLDDLPLVFGTAVLAWAVLREEGWRGAVHWVSAPLWAFAGWNLIVVVLTDASSVTALAKGPGRWALVALAFSLMINVLSGRRDLQRVALSALLVVGLAEALFGLWSYLVDWTIRSEVRAVLIGLELWRWYQPLVESTPGRISGTLGVSSNFLGGLMLVPTLIALVWVGVARSARARVAASVAFFATFMALVLSYTRASVVAILGAGVLLLLVLRRRVAAVTAVTALALALVATPVVSRFFDEGNDRLALTERALSEIANNPEFGLGPGSQGEGIIDPELQVLVATPHNSFLLAGAETGAAGAILLLVGALAPGVVGAWAVVRGRREPGLLAGTAGLLAMGIQTFSNNLLHIPTVAAWYWLAAAIAVAIAADRSPMEHESESISILGSEPDETQHER